VKKGDEKRAHRGSRHDLTNDRNLCVFTSEGVFGNHNHRRLRSVSPRTTREQALVIVYARS